MAAGIYVHIPFCIRKCSYCDFYSLSYSEDRLSAYVNALCKDIAESSSHYTDKIFDTVYFGGGTPSLLAPDQLTRILSALKNYYNISSCAEITVECNPESLKAKFLDSFEQAGGNRISLGIQSFSDSELHASGRLADLHTNLEALRLIKDSGIKNFSCDLMLSLPRQTKESLLNSIDILKENRCKHISLYSLKVEPATPIAATDYKVNEDTEYESYLEAAEHLEKYGYLHYEISNYSLPGYESRHNLKYWSLDEYLGFGPSAHSFMNEMRFFTSNDLNNYILGHTEALTEFDYREDPKEKLKDKVMLSLRTSSGLDLRLLKDYENDIRLSDFIDLVCSNEYGAVINGHLILNKKGMWIMNYIAAKLLSIID